MPLIMSFSSSVTASAVGGGGAVKALCFGLGVGLFCVHSVNTPLALLIFEAKEAIILLSASAGTLGYRLSLAGKR